MLSDGEPVWPKQKQTPLSHPFFSYSIGSFLFGSESLPHSALGQDLSPTTDPVLDGSHVPYVLVFL